MKKIFLIFLCAISIKNIAQQITTKKIYTNPPYHKLFISCDFGVVPAYGVNSNQYPFINNNQFPFNAGICFDINGNYYFSKWFGISIAVFQKNQPMGTPST